MIDRLHSILEFVTFTEYNCFVIVEKNLKAFQTSHLGLDTFKNLLAFSIWFTPLCFHIVSTLKL